MTNHFPHTQNVSFCSSVWSSVTFTAQAIPLNLFTISHHISHSVNIPINLPSKSPLDCSTILLLLNGSIYLLIFVRSLRKIVLQQSFRLVCFLLLSMKNLKPTCFPWSFSTDSTVHMNDVPVLTWLQTRLSLSLSLPLSALSFHLILSVPEEALINLFIFYIHLIPFWYLS